MKYIRIGVIMIFVFNTIICKGQLKIDSLQNALGKAKHDTTRVKVLNKISEFYWKNGENDTSLIIANKALKLSRKLNYERGNSEAFNNLGIIYFLMGNAPVAIENHLQALHIREKIGNKRAISTTQNNLGVAYEHYKKFDEALKCYNESLRLEELLKDQYGIASSYNNIGNIYSHRKNYKKALDYYMKSYSMFNEINSKGGMIHAGGNIGNTYADLGEEEKGLPYYEKTLQLQIEEKEYWSIPNTYYNMSSMYLELGNTSKAKEYATLALKEGKKNGLKQEIKLSYHVLSLADSILGDFKSAYFNLYLYDKYKDSTLSDDGNQKILALRMQYDFDKRKATDSIANAKKSEMQNLKISAQNAELKSKRVTQYFLFGGIFVLLVFALFIYNRFKVISKQKRIIEIKEKETNVQKEIIEEKQKEIIDSINYAQRLQQAILARKSEIDKFLPENFLLYLPKDIVAGDFYFFEVTDKYIFYAAADCTGHGVPGAMVSIVCSNALTRSVKEFDISDPGLILNKTRELILDTFNKSGDDVKDGMDISLIVLKYEISNNVGIKFTEIKWAGANNPLWYIENEIMKEIKADKQSIGRTDSPKPFTTHQISLTVSELFLFTDGYADQFGGRKGKKFKYSNLQKKLIENSSLQMESQCKNLEDSFNEWKGDLEQVDDVCVIGIRI